MGEARRRRLGVGSRDATDDNDEDDDDEHMRARARAHTDDDRPILELAHDRDGLPTIGASPDGDGGRELGWVGSVFPPLSACPNRRGEGGRQASFLNRIEKDGGPDPRPAHLAAAAGRRAADGPDARPVEPRPALSPAHRARRQPVPQEEAHVASVDVDRSTANSGGGASGRPSPRALKIRWREEQQVDGQLIPRADAAQRASLSRASSRGGGAGGSISSDGAPLPTPVERRLTARLSSMHTRHMQAARSPTSAASSSRSCAKRQRRLPAAGAARLARGPLVGGGRPGEAAAEGGGARRQAAAALRRRGARGVRRRRRRGRGARRRALPGRPVRRGARPDRRAQAAPAAAGGGDGGGGGGARGGAAARGDAGGGATPRSPSPKPPPSPSSTKRARTRRCCSSRRR